MREMRLFFFLPSFLARIGGIGSDRGRWMGVVVFVVGAGLPISISWSLMVAAAVCVHGDGAGVMGGTSLGVALRWHRGRMVICLGSFVFDFSGWYDLSCVFGFNLDFERLEVICAWEFDF